MHFEITNQWHGAEINHDPVKISLKPTPVERGLDIEVEAPFFDDPAPSGPPGEAFQQLWDYEG